MVGSKVVLMAARKADWRAALWVWSRAATKAVSWAVLLVVWTVAGLVLTRAGEKAVQTAQWKAVERVGWKACWLVVARDSMMASQKADPRAGG